jgi:hypothetical protein
MVGDAPTRSHQVIFKECHETLVQILWSLIRLADDTGQVEEVSPCGLETVVLANLLPNIT